VWRESEVLFAPRYAFLRKKIPFRGDLRPTNDFQGFNSFHIEKAPRQVLGLARRKALPTGH
jgi:hypothetical protein